MFIGISDHLLLIMIIGGGQVRMAQSTLVLLTHHSKDAAIIKSRAKYSIIPRKVDGTELIIDVLSIRNLKFQGLISYCLY